MKCYGMRTLVRASAVAVLSTMAVQAAGAQDRRVLPEGSVILVSTRQALESQNARAGQTFDTDVIDTLAVDGYTVIPAGSRIRGVVTFAQPATRSQSGVIELSFDRVMLSDGSTYQMSGKLTSTDSAERRQIDSQANSRVVLVGGRGGLGAAIAGAGSTRSPSANLLSALGSLLSEGRDVTLPAGSRLAVQLTAPLALRTRGIARATDVNSVFTASDRIRAAQRELTRLSYYRGVPTGQLDDATQRALVEYQIDKGLVATGNLDWRTARSLGVLTSVSGGDVGAKLAFSASEAGSLRRTSQALSARQRNDLGISANGGMLPQRRYAPADVDLWFALSAFADNAVVYEQIVINSGNTDGTTAAGRALVTAARHVDSAMSQANPSSQVRTAWATIRQQLAQIASDYR
jgi:peptidoglycan hydrolase-like protein with peptidoglycan-binding domain